MQTEAVSGSARCGWLLEIMRTARSQSSARIDSPASVRHGDGAATSPIDGDVMRARAAAASAVTPIATDACSRIASSRAISAASASIAAGNSAPLRPRSAARRNTHALAASTQLASMRPTPGTSNRSTVRPVGSSRPVMAPPGARKSRRIGLPVPATPGIARSPSSMLRPSRTRNVEAMILPVLVLWMRTVTSPRASGDGAASPSSYANGPTAELMLPQLPP